MVTITPSIKKDYPEAFRIARRDRFRVVWLEENLIYCARRTKGHGQYLVRLFAAESVAGGHQVKILCKSTTGARCHKMQFGQLCSHAAKVILRSEAKPEKQRKDQAA